MTIPIDKTASSAPALALALALALGAAAPAAAHAATDGAHWATSWYASPQPAWGAGFILPTGVPATLDDQTLRETVRVSAGGKRVRLVFSNRYGHAPVAIGRVRLALDGQAGAGHAVTFGGRDDAVLAPGAQLVSDAVALEVAPLARLSVSTWLPRPTRIDSFHWGAQQTVAVAGHDRTGAPDFAPHAVVPGRLFLSGVLVETAAAPHVVVALGDSITDGNGSSPDRDRRWPDALARRLAPHGIAVANAGISGARLLRDGMGVNALARLEQDVLAQPGARDLIVLLGTNDIGWPGSPFAPAEAPAELDDLVRGYIQLVASAHARGIRVIGATLPPFEGALEGTPYAGHYSDAKERLRRALNAWIRAGGAFDAVVDFDAVLRDPRHPGRLRPDYDSGDHLHPGDAGYAAMADAIDPALFIPASRPSPAPARPPAPSRSARRSRQ
ncbi:SGNH/GDSL hydrolase family protein [uncultured Massilia sp.]|uniref:SGNH/GDSL hydrolase family protein n=1 Tax=uncultured Massilia sp. TaxID=169973 RepID=UPI0025FFA145|nr:SGNH/GDSL hydrolase family protein [uncultured Massilia sp.]